MNRLVTVMRLHLVSLPFSLAMPWSVLATAFAINLGIFGVLGDDVAVDDRTTGGLASIYLFAFVAAIQAVTQLYPMALGVSLTRREFLGGTTLFLLAQSVFNAIALTVLLAIEHATDGWGLHLRFFGIPFIEQSNTAAQLAVYTGPFLAMSGLGLAVGAVSKRWGTTGMWVLTVSTMAVGGAAALFISWRQAWTEVVDSIADASALSIAAAYPLLLAVVATAGGYLVLRRTAP